MCSCIYIYIYIYIHIHACLLHIFMLQERARPEFEQKIKRYIRNCKEENAREKFFVYNPVLEKKEYIQPAHWFWPKVIATFSILVSMVGCFHLHVYSVCSYTHSICNDDKKPVHTKSNCNKLIWANLISEFSLCVHITNSKQ